MNRRLLLLLNASIVLTYVDCDHSLSHGGLRSHSGNVLSDNVVELPNALKARNDVDGRKLSKSGKSHKAKKAKTKPPTLSPTNTVVPTGSPTLTDGIEDPETPTQSPTQSPTEDGTVEKPGNPTTNPTKRPSMPTASPTAHAGTPVSNVATGGIATTLGCTVDPQSPPEFAIDGTTASFTCAASTPFTIGSAKFQVAKNKNSIDENDKGLQVKTKKLSVVTKLRVYSNTDCAGCDPVTYGIIGIDSNTSEEVTLSSGNLPWITNENVPRNPPGVSIMSTFESGDDSLTFTEVIFQNVLAFDTYVVRFGQNREEGMDLKVGEMELVGVVYEATDSPTTGPTRSLVTSEPTKSPTVNPTGPSANPTAVPSRQPTEVQSGIPSVSPTVKWDNRIHFNATDGENGDRYGQSVGVSDYTIVVGAPYKDEMLQNSGAAYILHENESSGAWEEIQKITVSDAKHYGRFGMNVALSEDVIAVCSKGNRTYYDHGAVFVFEYDETLDEWVEKDKLFGSGYSNGSPNSVAVSGKTIVAGSYRSNDVHIFNKNENTGKWVEEQRLNITEGIDERFGFSVGVSGNVIVVGAPSSNANVGSAYVYEFNDSSGLWEKVDELSPKDNQDVRTFGSSVGVFENIIVIGAPNSNSNIGSAYIFEKNITGSWVEVKRLEAPDYIQYSYFGHSVGVFGDYAVIGCWNCGSAYVFHRDPNGNWDDIPKKLQTANGDGVSVGISENAIAIGSPMYNSNTNGAVFIFE